MEMKVGGGEVRRLHIIYFLSRMGRVEQPHLIRIHHLAPNGVYLRDVKRWLSDLREKGLAESFAWYKAGYLWQDLLDDDLITPISDKEFFLKGSEIPSSDGDKKQDQESENGQKCCPHKSHDPRLRKTSPFSPEIISIQFESESSSGSMECSFKQDGKSVAKGAKDSNRDMGEEDSCYTSLLNKPRTKKIGTTLVAVSQHASNGLGRKSKSRSTAWSILRNLTTCCTVDTVDSVTVPTHHRIKKSSLDDLCSKVCNGDKLGGSARMFRALSNHYQHQHQSARNSCDGVWASRKKADKGEFSCPKSVPAAYKPVSYPTCSQCGKPFKPEKLHSHMKSCRGMKMFAKNAAASTSAARDIGRSSTSPDRETDRSSLLCH